jgi:hypothetical protein
MYRINVVKQVQVAGDRIDFIPCEQINPAPGRKGIPQLLQIGQRDHQIAHGLKPDGQYLSGSFRLLPGN